jgi:hypothetical protein
MEKWPGGQGKRRGPDVKTSLIKWGMSEECLPITAAGSLVEDPNRCCQLPADGVR